MKVARASEADLDCANKVASMIGDLEKRYMPDAPGKEAEALVMFDRDDAEDCKRALGMLLDEAAKGSLFRVVFGMTVVCDPRNELLDPAADTLEKHPKTVAALAADPVVAHNATLLAAVEAIRETESRKEAIALIEGLRR